MPHETARARRRAGRIEPLTIPHALGPSEFGAFLGSEDARWSAVVKSSGVTIE
jgi:hypothetical protein